MSGVINSTGAVSGVIGSSVLPSGVTGGSGLDESPLSYRNLIINGAMEVAQRGTSFAIGSGFTLDRHQLEQATGGGAITISQDTDVPAGKGFFNSMKFLVTTADDCASATDAYSWRHIIEGLNAIPLELGLASARTFTLSFWIKTSVAGTYAGGFANAANDRNYIFEYTTTGTGWEFQEISLTGDTTGTWLKTSGRGMQIKFSLGSGADRHDTKDTWQAGEKWNTSAATDFISTNSATMYITGIQLELGSVATPFEYRSYGEELMRCERYYQIVGTGRSNSTRPSTNTDWPIGLVSQYNTNVVYFFYTHYIRMRAAPSLDYAAGAYYVQYANGSADNFSNMEVSVTGANISRIILETGQISGTGGQEGYIWCNSASGHVAWLAEI